MENQLNNKYLTFTFKELRDKYIDELKHYEQDKISTSINKVYELVEDWCENHNFQLVQIVTAPMDEVSFIVKNTTLSSIGAALNCSNM